MSQPLSRRTFLSAFTAFAAIGRVGRAGDSPANTARYMPSFLHPNERWVILRGDRDFQFEIVDLETGRLILRLPKSQCDTWYGEPDVRFDPSGRYVVMGYDGTHYASIQAWDLQAPGPPVDFPMEDLDGDAPRDELREEERPRVLFDLPHPGGFIRLPRADRTLPNFRLLDRRLQSIHLTAASSRKSTRVQLGQGPAWSLATWERDRNLARLQHQSTGEKVTTISMHSMDGPRGEVLRTLPVALAPRSKANSVLVWSGYSTVREIDASSGKLLRCLAATMPSTGVLAFGSTRTVLYATRPLDTPFRWNRNGVITQGSERIGEGNYLIPPGSTYGPPPPTHQEPDQVGPLGVRALGRGAAGLALGLDRGEVWVGRGQDKRGGPWRLLGSHGGAVRTLRFVPGRPWLLSGAQDGSLTIWDLNLGKRRMRLPVHEARVNAASIHSPGLAATCGPDGIRLWDLEAGTLSRHLETGGAWVSEVALSPDGLRVAGALLDGTVRMWNVQSGAQIWSAQADAGWGAAIAFHPEGTHLVAGYELGQIWEWNPNSGARIRSLHVQGDTYFQKGPRPVHAMAWSVDGLALAVAYGDAVRVYDANLQSPKGTGWLLALDWADDYT